MNEVLLAFTWSIAAVFGLVLLTVGAVTLVSHTRLWWIRRAYRGRQ